MTAVTPPVAGAVDVIACDWNGTLVDDRERAYAATCAVIASRGLALPAIEDFLADFRLPLGALLAHYDVLNDVPRAIEEWSGVMAQFPARAMPGAEVMLAALSEQGTPVAVVSAASAEVLRRDITLLGFELYIDTVFDLADPKRNALRKLREQHGPVVAFVGDTEYDIAEAKAAGAISIGFAGGYRPYNALLAAEADHVTRNLADVIPTLFPVDVSLAARGGRSERGVVVRD